MDIQTAHIIEIAKSFGASLAGVAAMDSLKTSLSHKIYYGQMEWPPEAKSALVLALAHTESEPELDWWGVEGGSPGNRRLQDMAKILKQYLREFDIAAQPWPYSVEKGGIFLKDAAALAGLGVIGANNLLLTPEFGPRVRLRALSLDLALAPTGPLDFSPCDTCDRPCWRACPQQAFASGAYSKPMCDEQMKVDEANRGPIEYGEGGDVSGAIKYCRACELACPVGKE